MSKLSKFLAASLVIFSTSVSADFSGIWRTEFPKNGTVTNVADKFDVYLIQEKTPSAASTLARAAARQK